MTVRSTIGFPRMMKEAGEKRVFLPEFMEFLTERGASVFVEEGYGSRSGYTVDDFRRTNKAIQTCSRQEAFQKDIVIVLRSPKDREFEMIPPGRCLISMLHYPTRPKRVEILKNHEIHSISLDSIVNDNNIRLVENMKAVAWNGLQSAFELLEKKWPHLVRPDSLPIHVLSFGTGMVGKHAVDAATKLGNVEKNNQCMADGFPGVVVTTTGRSVTGNPSLMERLFRQADILVDATQRRNPSEPVVPNDWIQWLPEHAVIVDLAVDPYTLDTNPPVVRGVEGIPQGNLDKYKFQAGDSDWDQTVPTSIPSTHRRAVTSCYSWPGVHPEPCMRHYQQQLEPLMEILLEKGYAGLSEEGGYFERALYRATLRCWLNSST